ncbi:hypothetical protein A2U01_0070562, partial [Trifolium medium]|nr:hypothetical protein [Trifolium medium]
MVMIEPWEAYEGSHDLPLWTLKKDHKTSPSLALAVTSLPLALA